MDSSPLGSYVSHAHKSGAFDLINEAEKAIRWADNSTALMKLGELRSLIWIMHYHIESLEEATSKASS